MRFFLFGLVGLLLVGMAFSLNKQRDCKCRAPVSRRIIGGKQAVMLPRNLFLGKLPLSEIEENPVPEHLRKLLPDKEMTKFHRCGGSIINENFILIAAHCVRFQIGNSMINTEIGFGSNDLGEIYIKKQYKQIKALYMHPDHEPFSNDIALIELASPLEFNETVQPACLDFEPQYLYYGGLKISGWGLTHGETTNLVAPRFLKEADVFDYSQESTCKGKQNICMRNEKHFETSCLGDSGGPVHYIKNGKSSVVGVSSWVSLKRNKTRRYRCTGDMYYTRLSSFKSWVESKIGKEYCS